MELTIEKIIYAFSELGKKIQERPDTLKDAVNQAASKNRWFEEASIWQSLNSIANWLDSRELIKWLQPYSFERISDQKVGLVFAGNLPLVGFHVLLSVVCSGFKAQIKLSSDDQVLYKYLLQELFVIEPQLEQRVEIVDRLQDFDLVIATGSDNSARYFEYYFGKKPHIIRKNRNSVAVLDGHESSDDLRLLGHDILDHYGMGCRSVSKIFVPKDYDLSSFFEGIEVHQVVRDNFKYFNNYEFQKSILLINNVPHLDNGFLLVKEDQRLASPLSILYYERYENSESLERTLNDLHTDLQCVVSGSPLSIQTPVVGFGESQAPFLTDYADQVDTLAFLSGQLS